MGQSLRWDMQRESKPVAELASSASLGSSASVALSSRRIITKKVLVVDDDDNILNLIELCLSTHFQVRRAHSGEEALRLIREEEPDLLLLDLMMPKMDGKEVCREIRRSSDLRVVFLSASDESVASLHDPILRISGYIPKPFDPDDLLRRVASYLN